MCYWIRSLIGTELLENAKTKETNFNSRYFVRYSFYASLLGFKDLFPDFYLGDKGFKGINLFKNINHLLLKNFVKNNTHSLQTNVKM